MLLLQATYVISLITKLAVSISSTVFTDCSMQFVLVKERWEWPENEAMFGSRWSYLRVESCSSVVLLASPSEAAVEWCSSPSLCSSSSI